MCFYFIVNAYAPKKLMKEVNRRFNTSNNSIESHEWGLGECMQALLLPRKDREAVSERPPALSQKIKATIRQLVQLNKFKEIKRKN